MSTFDWILLVILLAFGVKSLVKGLIKQTMSFIGLIVGFLCARLFGAAAGEMLLGPKNPWLSEAAGYLIVFAVVMLIFWGLSFAMKVTLKKTPVAWFDKAGGFLFGCILGATLLSLVLLSMKSVELFASKHKMPSPTTAVFKTSILANALPRYTVCLFLKDLKSCQALAAKTPPPAAKTAPKQP